MADFETVRNVELAEIKILRNRRRVRGCNDGTDLTGICFSGGGIRSATFCLGVLQGLASYWMLRRFDYISSVSGGGYIASWLISWIKRPGDKAKPEGAKNQGIDIIEKALREAPPHLKQTKGVVDDVLASVEREWPASKRWPILNRLIGCLEGRVKGGRETRAIKVEDGDVLRSAERCEPTTACKRRQQYEEPGALNFLRSYSNYLTPRLGFFGADAWVAVATYIRNLLLNQSILVSALAAVILVPRVVQWVFDHLLLKQQVSAWCAGGPALAFLLFSLTFIDWNIANFSLREAAAEHFSKKEIEDEKLDERLTGRAGQTRVIWFGVLPIFAAAVLGTLGLAQLVKTNAHLLTEAAWYWWVIGGAVGYLGGRCAAQGMAWFLVIMRWKWPRRDTDVVDAAERERARNTTRKVWPTFWQREVETYKTMWHWAWVAGGFGGLLLWQLSHVFRGWLKHPAGVAHLVSWGPPMVVSIVLLTGVLHVGLMNYQKFPNQKKEWWSRLAAWLLIGTLGWALLFDVALFAPLGVLKLSGWLKTKTALIASWAGATLYGVLAGKSSATSGEKGGVRPLELATTIAPYIFIIGTLVLISYGIYAVLGNPPGVAVRGPTVTTEMQGRGKLELTGSSIEALQSTLQFSLSQNAPTQSSSWGDEYWKSWDIWRLLIALIGLAGIAVLLACRVNINEYSFHLFYRNRLVRCYLGATNPERCPHPFTGFDPADDIFLKDFGAKVDEKYSGPYPIFNAALNITHGQRLAWQERRAESFVLTPRFCGFDFQEERDRPKKTRKNEEQAECEPKQKKKGESINFGYRRTRWYGYRDGGLYLGTAVATSGAAVNPNMGYHASAAVAFLLTLFNVRLGWWLGNPRRKKFTRDTPRLGLFYLLGELFGLTDDTSNYINLSDGWHFENLGLYELVRRECKYILVCDVGADQGFGREDLGNAIRKCRSDFGVEIEMDVSPLRPDKDGLSESHFVSGTILYPNGGTGRILYIKSGLTGKEPQDILAYKVANPVFPHQSTGDQWFNESQFESYRALGRFAVESMLSRIGDPEVLKSLTTAQIFQALG